jgi:hypothetical protein
MRRAAILLVVIAVVIASPVLIPIAAVLHARERRHMRAVVRETRCEGCGAILGDASLHRADAVWGEYVATLHRDQPGILFRLLRRLWAVCTVCGAEYDFDAARRAFLRFR